MKTLFFVCGLGLPLKEKYGSVNCPTEGCIVCEYNPTGAFIFPLFLSFKL